MSIQINSARYVTPAHDIVDLDLMVDGERIAFALVPGDAAPVAIAVRDAMASGQIAIANYVESTSTADPVPMRVTLAQARAALIAAGLFDTINTYVTASNDATLKTAWEYSNTVSRHGHFVTTLAPVFGFTDAQLDDLFRAANKIDF